MSHFKVYLENGQKVIKTVAKSMLGIVPITQQQYDQLSTEAKNNGTIYNITDRNCTAPNASMVKYGSGTVKDALDSLNESLSKVFYAEVLSTTVSINASSRAVVQFTPSNPSGYTLVAVTPTIGDAGCAVEMQRIASNGIYVYAINYRTTAVSNITVVVRVLYLANQ